MDAAAGQPPRPFQPADDDAEIGKDDERDGPRLAQPRQKLVRHLHQPDKDVGRLAAAALGVHDDAKRLAQLVERGEVDGHLGRILDVLLDQLLQLPDVDLPFAGAGLAQLHGAVAVDEHGRHGALSQRSIVVVQDGPRRAEEDEPFAQLAAFDQQQIARFARPCAREEARQRREEQQRGAVLVHDGGQDGRDGLQGGLMVDLRLRDIDLLVEGPEMGDMQRRNGQDAPQDKVGREADLGGPDAPHGLQGRMARQRVAGRGGIVMQQLEVEQG